MAGLGRKFNLGKLTSELVGQPYSLGGVNGHDCASLVLAITEMKQTEWEGFTTENYPEFYRTRPEQAKEVLACWASQIGREIHPNKAFAGDILIVRTKNGKQKESPGVVIHGGQDCVLAVFDDRGVSVAPIRAYEILKAYRWRKD